MVVLVTCNNDEDPSKNECTRVLTTFLLLYVYGDVSRRSRAANSAVPGWITQKSVNGPTDAGWSPIL